jgi:hypothetical protein
MKKVLGTIVCSFIVFFYPLQCVADDKKNTFCKYNNCTCVKEQFWSKSGNLTSAIDSMNEISINIFEQEVTVLQNLLAIACPKENAYHWAWIPSLTTITMVTGIGTLIVISANHMRSWGWWGLAQVGNAVQLVQIQQPDNGVFNVHKQ